MIPFVQVNWPVALRVRAAVFSGKLREGDDVGRHEKPFWDAFTILPLNSGKEYGCVHFMIISQLSIFELCTFLCVL